MFKTSGAQKESRKAAEDLVNEAGKKEKKNKSMENGGAKHPTYKGVRMRKWGRWVSEIREPKKKSRIWLGTYSTAEMAARAHDVAALAIKGHSAHLNFPELEPKLHRPLSTSHKDIQAAAAQAAATTFTEQPDELSPVNPESSAPSSQNNEDDAFFDLPDLFVNRPDLNESFVFCSSSSSSSYSWQSCEADSCFWLEEPYPWEYS